MRPALYPALLCLALIAAPAFAPAQGVGVPYVPDAWKYGRRSDESRLRICVDRRDAAWKVEREIGEAIAGALLLEPMIHEVTAGPEVDALDELYEVMLRNCAVHLGFKLLPNVYPDWLTLSRPYYVAEYVFATRDPSWTRLGDVPPGSAIASTLGTRADYRLTSYILSMGDEERWARHPYGTAMQAIAALYDGAAEVALVWEPALWATGEDEGAARVIGASPLPESSEGVGAVILARETYLRTSIDMAISALLADGIIAEILEHHGFPARAAR